MKISEIKIVSSTLSALGIDIDTKKTNAKKQIKERIETGSLSIESLNAEQAEEFKQQLSLVYADLKNQKAKMTIDEMIEKSNQLELMATVFDQIAISNYNFATSQHKLNKELAQDVAKTVLELTQVFSKEIELKQQEQEQERIEFIKAYVASELSNRQIWDWCADFKLFYLDSFKNKTSVNYKKDEDGKEIGISSVKKPIKDHVSNIIQGFETAKQVIDNHQHQSVIYDYYVKSGYDLNIAIEQTKEYERMKLEEEEREKARLQAEEEKRKAIQAQLAEEKRLADELAAKQVQEIEDQREKLETVEEISDIIENKDIEMIETKQEENAQEELTPIQKLERAIWLENMAERPNQNRIDELNEKLNKFKNPEQATSGNMEAEPTGQAQEAIVKYQLYTSEKVETPLEQALISAKVEVNKTVVVYTVSIAKSRCANFEMWFENNNIKFKRLGE